MAEIIELCEIQNGPNRIQHISVEFPDEGVIITHEMRHDDGDYVISWADWLCTGGIDHWESAYVGTSRHIIEAWQRAAAWMGI